MLMSSNSFETSSAQAVLSTIYEYFCLLNGTFESIAAAKGPEGLRTALSLFFAWYLTPLPASSPILGIRYLTLDSAKFMKLQSFLNHVAFSRLNKDQINSLLLYNEQLVSSSLPLRQTKSLYSYLNHILIPEAVCIEVATPKERAYWFKKHEVVHVPDKRSMSVFRTVNGATLALFHQESFDVDSLTSLCAQELYSLAILLCPQQNEPVNLVSDPSISYVYVNDSNAALKTSSTTPSSNLAVSSFEQDIKLLTDTEPNSQSRRKPATALQVLARNEEDNWLGVQRADERTLYCTLTNHKNASLSEAAVALPFPGVFE